MICKRSTLRTLVLLVVMCFLIALFPVNAFAAKASSTASTYYVDADNGSDANDGLDPETAWKSLDKVNNTDFMPGDSILFKAGCIWTGELVIDDSGYMEERITIDMYDDGPKPVIAGNGIQRTVYIHNAEYLTVQNLEITNDAPENANRSGVYVQNDTMRTLRSIHIKNLDIHDIKGNYMLDNRWASGAVFFKAYGLDSSYDDFIVEGCHIYDNSCQGIWSDGDEDTKATTLFTNVVIRNNVFERNALGDIVTGVCEEPLIEYNASYDHGENFSNFEYTVPIWEWGCKDSLFQFNEVARCRKDPAQADGLGDSQGFDTDIATIGYTTFQYNYSHDNAGGFLLVMGDNNRELDGTIARYNISFNDHRQNIGDDTFSVHNAGRLGTFIYNNVFYNNVPGEGIVVSDTHTGDGGVYYQNNIFYADGSCVYPSESETVTFDNNLYYGEGNVPPESDENAIVADPMFAGVIPDTPLDGMDKADIFKIKPSSPCIDAGTPIENNGGRDYWGNKLYNGAPDIGVHEYGSSMAAIKPYKANLLKIPEAANVNNHTGNWSIQADSTATASESEIVQTVSGIRQNTDYVAEAWVKGVGGFTLSVKDTETGSVLADEEFSASAEWAKVSLEVNSGSSDSLVYSVSETGGIEGTAYIDDMFLGTAEGSNLLENGSFEFGGVPWTIGDIYSFFRFTPTPEPTPEPTPAPDLPTDARQITDEFDSEQLGDNWSWVRENVENWSLTENPGSMTIHTQPGDISTTNTSAENLLLQLAPEGDFTLITKVSGIPTTDWEQSGMMVYVDDDNYIKLNRLYDGSLKFQFGYEEAGAWSPSNRTAVEDPQPETEEYYLKLVKTGAAYTGYFSYDGEGYTQIGAFNVYLKSVGVKQIGLYSVAGSAPVAKFDYFRIHDMDIDAEEPASAPENTPEPLPADAHTGVYALQARKPVSGGEWFSMGYSDIEVEPNTEVVAKMWIKGQGDVCITIASEDWGSYPADVSFTATGMWTEVSTPVIDTGDNTRLNFMIKTTDNYNVVFIDDVFLGPTGGQNAMINTSFESGSSPWWNVSGEPFSVVEKEVVVSKDSTHAHSGEYAVMVQHLPSDSEWKSMGYSDIPVAEAVYMEAKMWIKGSGTIYMTIADQNWGTLSDTAFKATDEWTEVSRSVYSPAGNTKMQYMIKTSNDFDTIFVDDVFLGLEDGENGISNSGFEEGTDPWWSVSGPFKRQIKTQMSAYTGDFSLQIKNTGNDAWKSIGYSDISVTEAAYSEVSMWTMGSGTFNAVIMDQNWALLDEVSFTAGQEWKSISTQVYSPAGNTKLQLMLKTTESFDSIYVDDLFVGPEGGENALTNPSFENGTAPWWGVARPFFLRPNKLENANRAPVFDAAGDITVNEGSVLSFTPSAYDQENGLLTYTADLPEGATLDASTGYLNWRPDFTQVGTHQIEYTVYDNEELTDIMSLNVNVKSIPAIDSISNVVINEGETLYLQVDATDADGDTLSYGTSYLPWGARFFSTTNTLVWTPSYEQAGAYTVRFDVNDGSHITSETVQITVKVATPKSGSVPSGGQSGTTPDTSGDTGEVKANPLSEDAFDEELESVPVSEDGLKTVKVEIEEVSGARSYAVMLPSVALTSSEEKHKLEITTALGTIMAPGNMLTSSDVSEGDSVELIIGQGDTSSIIDQSVLGEIGDRPVVQLNVRVNGQAISWNNPNAHVTVTIPYVASDEELKNFEYITVMYIDSEGYVTKVPSGRYNAENKTVTFTATHFSKYAVAYSKKAFADMSGTDWAIIPAQVMAAKGIVDGTTNVTFSPANNMTRGEFVMSLVKTLGLTTEFDSNFGDMDSSDSYYKAVGIAKELGIVKGFNNLFNANRNVTRQDMIVLTNRALEAANRRLPVGTTDDLAAFEDASDVSDYAVNDVVAMVKAGLIKGDGTNLDPKEEATRAEVAQLLYRVYNN